LLNENNSAMVSPSPPTPPVKGKTARARSKGRCDGILSLLYRGTRPAGGRSYILGSVLTYTVGLVPKRQGFEAKGRCDFFLTYALPLHGSTKDPQTFYKQAS
jgi:hypothetical protein